MERLRQSPRRAEAQTSPPPYRSMRCDDCGDARRDPDRLRSSRHVLAPREPASTSASTSMRDALFQKQRIAHARLGQPVLELREITASPSRPESSAWLLTL